MKRSRTGFPLTVVLLLAVSAAAPAAAQTTESQPAETLPGFKPKQVYDANPVDNVNLHNGDPQLVVPLGPEYPLGAGSSWRLRAYYSARIWHLSNVGCPGTDCGPTNYFYRGHVGGNPALGVGWTLEMGTIIPPDPSLPFDTIHHYRSPDGAEHELNSRGDGFLYTGPPLSLRVRWDGNGYLLWRPDGTRLRFYHAYYPPTPANGYDFSDLDRDKQPWARYGLTEMVDPFDTTLMTVHYVNETTPTSPDAWKVSQVFLSGNRLINLSWGSWQGFGVSWPVLTSVTFPVNGGGTLTTTLTFLANDNTLATRFNRTALDWGGASNCFPLAATLREISAPILTAVTTASHAYSFRYRLGNDAEPQGILSGFTTPTGSKVDYTYQTLTVNAPCMRNASGCGNPETQDHSPPPTVPDTGQQVCRPVARYHRFLEAAAAVVLRTETDLVTGLVASTSYYRRGYSEPDYSEIPAVPDAYRIVRQVIVRRPDGVGGTIATKYLFSASTVSLPGFELERRYYAGTAAGDSASPVRTNVNCYDGSPGGCGVLDSQGKILDLSYLDLLWRNREVTWYGVNPQGGGDCAPATTPACWQRQLLSWDNDAEEYRTERISSNSSFLLYDDTGPTQPSTRYRDRTTAWSPVKTSAVYLPKLFTSKTVFDSFSSSCPFQPCRQATSYSFDTTNGFLQESSIDGDSYGTLSRTREQDGAGNLWKQTDWGNWSGAGRFKTTRTYQNGLPITSIRDGLAVPWFQFNVARDGSTGLITTSYDPNNLSTAYQYDSLGRLTSVTPPGESTTTYCYHDWTPGSPSQGAYVLVKKGASNACNLDEGAPSAGSGAFEAFLFDGNGRLIKELRRAPNLLPGGSYFSFRQTGYDNADHMALSSEWIPCPSGASSTNVSVCFSAIAPTGNTTRFSQFDFLGRPKRIDAPDGSFSTKSYDDGTLFNSDTFEYTATSFVGGQVVYGAFRKDILGRTLIVAEPGPPPFGPFSCYSYNTLDKLAFANITCSGQQNRTFAHDRFGFLRSEFHPEKGTTFYLEYDALGNVRKKREGGVNYRYANDTLGRPLTVKADALASPSYEPTTAYVENFWDGVAGPAGGSPNGRLTRRIGRNPGVYPSSLINVAEDLTYAGLGGRPSQKTTTISNGAASTMESWTYNSLGLVAAESYPRVAPQTGTFAVTTSYKSGLPTAVSANGQAVVTSATYNPSGGLASYTTGNGIKTTIEPDPSLTPRPRRIYTSDGNFDTGVYSYDGAGNILGMGPDTFMYDPNSRLLSAKYPAYSSIPQTYEYDVYGNLTKKAGVTIGVNPATNRLTGAAYDSSGNVTSLAGETYSYDALNRQTKHDAGSSHWSYLLDGANERIVKAIPAGSGFVLRREMARIILQARGDSPRAACAGYFQDVPCTDPDRGWIEKFYELGITSGCSATPRLYCPESTATRAQMAVFISVAMVLPGTVPASGTVSGVGSYNCTTGGTSLFTDVLPTDGTCRFIHYILANNVTAGCSVSPRKFCPNDTTPHWQMEVFVSQAWNGFQYVPPGATYTFRGPAGALLTEYQDSKVSKDYVYLGTRLVGTNQSTGGWQFHATDHLGSTRLTTNAAGAVVERRKYWPWGEEVSPPGPGRLAFAGMELDLEASRPRYYDHARNLETGNGRFLSPDKLGGKIGDPQSWNRYTYARNNPLKYIDPNGQETVTVLPEVQEKLNSPGHEARANIAFGAFAAAAVAPVATGAFGGISATGLVGLDLAGVSSSVFKLGIAARGFAIEAAAEALAGGGALVGNFPVIDRFMNGTATSVKSLDLLSKTYQQSGRVLSTLSGYIDKLASFEGASRVRQVVGGVGTEIQRRILEIAVQKGVASPSQIEQVKRAADYAKTQDIELRVLWVAGP